MWDVFADQEFLGGAPLNFATNCQRLDHSSALLSAIGNDQRGELALEAMRSSGVDTTFIQKESELPTGTAVVTSDADGEPSFEIIRPAAYDLIKLTEETLGELRSSDFDWLYFGTLMLTEPRVEEITLQLAKLSPGIRCFYDVNLRPNQWNIGLVQRLLRLATVVKLNESEAKIISESNGTHLRGSSGVPDLLHQLNC